MHALVGEVAAPAPDAWIYARGEKMRSMVRWRRRGVEEGAAVRRVERRGEPRAGVEEGAPER